MKTTWPQLIKELRALAVALEKSFLPDAIDASCQLWVHCVNDRDTLRSWVALMDSPEAVSLPSSPSIDGRIAGIRCNLFYKAGLLGKVKEVRVVECEDKPDLQSLFVGDAP